VRGQIINVASAGKDQADANTQIAELVGDRLRHARAVFAKRLASDAYHMNDADVAAPTSLRCLITFFYRQMRPLIDQGHPLPRVPPL